MLIHSLKFHVRSYFIVYVNANSNSNSNSIYVDYYNEYRILTAAKPYEHANYNNTDIHLSDGHNTVKRYFWPEDFKEEYDTAFLHKCQTSINECNSMIIKLLKSVNLKPYSESNAGFEIYCADILLDANGKAWLLEINSKCGFGQYGEVDGWDAFNKKFSDKFFNWVLKTLIDKLIN